VYVILIFALSRLFHFEASVVGIIGAIVLAIVLAAYLRYRAMHFYPKCQNPECQGHDYTFIDVKNDKRQAGSKFEMACKKCGQKYLLSTQAFMVLDNDHRPVKYMKRSSAKGRWELDT
jgi:hypothetical protein